MRNQELRLNIGLAIKLELYVFAALLGGGGSWEEEYSTRIPQSLERI